MNRWIRLIRPASGLTATTNVLAGRLLVGPPPSATEIVALMATCLASFSLYSGGMALNDVADYRDDIEHRPHRPLPLGEIRRTHALLAGSALLGFGWILSASVGSAGVTTILVALILTYNFAAKKAGLLGAFVMASCRFANVALGAQLAPTDVELISGAVELGPWSIPIHAFALFAYTFCLTTVSLLEDRRSSRVLLLAASIPLLLSCLGPLAYASLWALPIAAPLTAGILLALVRAMDDPGSPRIELIVRSAVLGMPLLDAAALLGNGHWVGAAATIFVVLVARRIARITSAT